MAPPWANKSRALPPGSSSWPSWGLKLDADEVQNLVRGSEVDVARFAGKHAVEAERGDQPARLGLAVQRLLPVQPAHADHQPFLALPPDDVRGLHPGILHMGGDHGEIVGIERDQFELGRHRRHFSSGADTAQRARPRKFP
ncbi:hypothetical protein ACVMHW_004671 [Bradyrhizobium diazoefficiens]